MILRKENKAAYTTIPQHITKDERLSLKDLGLLVKMLSLPDNWEFSENGLIAILSNDGQTSVRTGLKKLEEYGYLHRKRTRNDKGQMGIVEWILTDCPHLENPSMDNPNTDNPIMENQPQLNTKQSNTNRQNTKKSNTKGFVPPTLDEVIAYCKERKNNVDAKKFFDYFTAGDWKDKNGNQVKSWKQKIITWEGYCKAEEKPKASLYDPEDNIDDLF